MLHMLHSMTRPFCRSPCFSFLFTANDVAILKHDFLSADDPPRPPTHGPSGAYHYGSGATPSGAGASRASSSAQPYMGSSTAGHANPYGTALPPYSSSGPGSVSSRSVHIPLNPLISPSIISHTIDCRTADPRRPCAEPSSTVSLWISSFIYAISALRIATLSPSWIIISYRGIQLTICSDLFSATLPELPLSIRRHGFSGPIISTRLPTAGSVSTLFCRQSSRSSSSFPPIL